MRSKAAKGRGIVGAVHNADIMPDEMKWAEEADVQYVCEQ